jgi:hypothetical protein
VGGRAAASGMADPPPVGARGSVAAARACAAVGTIATVLRRGDSDEIVACVIAARTLAPVAARSRCSASTGIVARASSAHGSSHAPSDAAGAVIDSARPAVSGGGSCSTRGDFVSRRSVITNSGTARDAWAHHLPARRHPTENCTTLAPPDCRAHNHLPSSVTVRSGARRLVMNARDERAPAVRNARTW